MYTPTDAEKKAVKGRGFLANSQGGGFSARIITVNGVITHEQARTIAEAAEKFGNGEVAFTTRLTVELPGVKYEDIEAFTEFIGKAGLVTGGTGSVVRPVVACKGTVCIHGLYDTQALAKKIHHVFYEGWHTVKLPHKFKIGVGGCPNNCIKPDLNDLGIIGQAVPAFDEDMCNTCKKCIPMENCPVNAIKHEDGAVVLDREICNNCGKCIDKCPFDAIEEDKRGYRIYLGGKWGKSVRRGTPIDRIFTEDEVMSIIEKALLIYREQGITGERFGVTVDRIGFDSFVAQLLKDDILERKQAILDAQLHLVGGAQC
jgi:dissimilatory sulfite reductase (desulfoviridin) alpha/beta subunit